MRVQRVFHMIVPCSVGCPRFWNDLTYNSWDWEVLPLSPHPDSLKRNLSGSCPTVHRLWETMNYLQRIQRETLYSLPDYPPMSPVQCLEDWLIQNMFLWQEDFHLFCLLHIPKTQPASTSWAFGSGNEHSSVPGSLSTKLPSRRTYPGFSVSTTLDPGFSISSTSTAH